MDDAYVIYSEAVNSLNTGRLRLREISSDTKRSNDIRCHLLHRPVNCVVSFHELVTARLQYDVPGLYISNDANVDVRLSSHEQRKLTALNLREAVSVLKLSLPDAERSFYDHPLYEAVVFALHGLKNIQVAIAYNHQFPTFNDRITIMKESVALRIARNRDSSARSIMRVTQLDALTAFANYAERMRSNLANGTPAFPAVTNLRRRSEQRIF
jgi:hypothetical protein